MTVQKGYFEVAKFHGIDVAIFDSHWFANIILKEAGRRYMCGQIIRATNDIVDTRYIPQLPCFEAAMAPYRDFMAKRRYKYKNKVHVKYLSDVFLYTQSEREFRLEAAQRMLAADPIRYCIPVRIFSRNLIVS